MSAKLHEGPWGWVANIIHHSSPNYNQTMVVPSGVQGVIFHTMVGNLPGTDAEFDNAAMQLSAHFGVGQDGTCIQWVDIRGGEAWAEAAGNEYWYSVEMADNGNPNNPYTNAQLDRAAQLAELLSRPSVGNFPLQVTDSVSGEGLGTHNMGGAAWGGHSCPDMPPEHVRSEQRGEIIRRAELLRTGDTAVRHVADGKNSLLTAAARVSETVEHIKHVTRHSHEITLQHLEEFNQYCLAGDDHLKMPTGLVWYSSR